MVQALVFKTPQGSAVSGLKRLGLQLVVPEQLGLRYRVEGLGFRVGCNMKSYCRHVIRERQSANPIPPPHHGSVELAALPCRRP